MAAVAKALLGEPNPRHSKHSEWRYGTNGSLKVDVVGGRWYDFETEEGGNVLELICGYRECDEKAAAQWMRDQGILTNGRAGYASRVVATFSYQDEGGKELFQVLRYEPKDFRQRHRRNGEWVWNVEGVRVVPYKLPQLNEALALEQIIFIVEGERKADLLWSWNIPATCNAMGAASSKGKSKKWTAEHAAFLRNADVILMPDNDQKGRDHIEVVGKSLVGVAYRVRVLELPGLKPKGDIIDWAKAGGTADKLWHLVETSAVPFEKQSPGDDGVSQGPEGLQENDAPGPGHNSAAVEVWDAGDDPGAIPPREWLLALQFCRKFISSLVALGGTGKSALRLLQYVSLALGSPLTGQHVFRRCRVLLISLEDDMWELHRRIAAVLKHYNIDRAEMKGWLFFATPKLFKLAVMTDKGRSLGPLEQFIREEITRRKIDLVSLDPFVKTHALEENNSTDMDFVCDLLARMSIEFNIAVDSPHHMRKGATTPGDADAGRGSSGIKDAGRLVFTLTPMSSEEAATYGIADEDRQLYVRLDSAKVNIIRRGGKTSWFKLVGVPLNNGTPDYPSGDEVQTVEPWTPPDTFEGLSDAALNAALTEIDKGMENGQRFSSSGAAKEERAAWVVVQKHCPTKTEAQCRQIINAWCRTKLLCSKEYDDPVERKKRKGLYVDNAKRPGTTV
jgi:hypothetical protein